MFIFTSLHVFLFDSGRLRKIGALRWDKVVHQKERCDDALMMLWCFDALMLHWTNFGALMTFWTR